MDEGRRDEGVTVVRVKGAYSVALQCYDHYSNLPRPRAVDGSFPELPIDIDTPA